MKTLKATMTAMIMLALVFLSVSNAKAALLHNFDSDAEGWYVHWGATGPSQVESPSYDGNGSIVYTSDVTDGSDFGVCTWYDTALDLSTYDYISAWIRTPEEAPGPEAATPTWLKLQVYTKSGVSQIDTWGALGQVEGNLTPGEWYQSKVYISEIFGTTDADPSYIQSIGVKVQSWNNVYTGTVHIDQVEAIPEPSTALLLGIFATSLLGIPSLRRKRK